VRKETEGEGQKERDKESNSGNDDLASRKIKNLFWSLPFLCLFRPREGSTFILGQEFVSSVSSGALLHSTGQLCQIAIPSDWSLGLIFRNFNTPLTANDPL